MQREFAIAWFPVYGNGSQKPTEPSLFRPQWCGKQLQLLLQHRRLRFY
jgi:hypothetical protein